MSRTHRPAVVRAAAAADLSHTPAREAAEPAVAVWERPVELGALGRAVRELRARRGFSQEQLGERSGLHRNYVGAVERGEINATFRVLMKLARGLQVPFSELIEVFERQRTWSVATSDGDRS
jgi:DNA-binding XRE family transcriptional regulator